MLRVDADEQGERIPLCEQHSPLALYDDEYEKGHGQKIGHVLQSVSGYSSTLPNAEEAQEKPVKTVTQMGTMMGVYLPCLQNIFGVLFFIRMTWIIGVAGILQSFFVVLLCASVTFLTSISLSAIATNGVVSAGGPYYMISRNLGPELGGAVGILFYLGTTIAAAMYITGAIEILILYLYPQTKLFDNNLHNFRVFGTVQLILLGCMVLAGVQVVNKFALPVVMVVILCMFSVFAGVFVNINGSDSLKFCMVGDRPVDLVGFMEKRAAEALLNGLVQENVPVECTSEGLEPLFCSSNGTCDPYFQRMRRVANFRGGKAVRTERGIKGLASGVFWENFWPKYQRLGDVLSKDPRDRTDQTRSPFSWVFSDMMTSYMVLVGVFFPSVTGIMAGSNRSGNLRDPARSIPFGTLGAQLTTSLVYFAGVFLFGGTVSEMLMRDKSGTSALGKLTIAELAWPWPRLIVIGSFLATTGAGLQSLTGAPRLLQAIASDDVIPFLRPFRETDRRGEPIRAILLTLCICELGILIAVIESIAALITQFFLMCYLGVNAACALQSILKAPGWRPGFKYFHWTLSLVGAFLCIAVMFISAWHFALIAIFIGAGVYKYIEFVGAEKEWGDGIRGLGLSAARFALLSLEDKKDHSRNWRPQLLVIAEEIEGSATDGLFSFVAQLKAGKGLTMVCRCVKGDFNREHEEAAQQREKLQVAVKKHRIKGFCDVLMSENVDDGICSLIQTSGLGGLRHNSVLLPWPEAWSGSSGGSHSWEVSHRFLAVIRASSAARCCILVTKGTERFPRSTDRINGTIDVWWIVHDGGLLMLLPFLLRQSKTWRSVQLRLFVIATIDDNNVQMKEDLKRFLYQLRITAEVHVIEMPDSDISDYTYERTLKMEERARLLKELGARQDAKKDLQLALDDVTRERKLSRITEDELGLPMSTSMDQRLATLREADERREAEEEASVERGHAPSSGSEAEEGGATPESAASVSDAASTAPEAEEKPAKARKGESRGVRFSDDEMPNHHENGGSNAKESHGSRSQTNSRRRRYNIHKMHTAVKLNELMRTQSATAQLIVVNLPGPPDSPDSDSYYMDFIDALTERLDRVLLVRGTGAEVVTIYS